MTALALALAAVLAIAAVLFVARPFLAAKGPDESPAPDAAAAERLRLLEERDRALAALKELEFDHRTHKISDADYAETVARLRREAADALAAVDELNEPDGPQAASDPRLTTRRSGRPR